MTAASSVSSQSPKPSDIWIVPEKLQPDDTVSLLVFLHGMGGSPEDFRDAFTQFADKEKFAVFLPCGQVRLPLRKDGKPAYTWDPGKDARRIVRQIRKQKTNKFGRTVIAGFSAGASMALITAIENPARVEEVVLFSGTAELNLLSMRRVEKAADQFHVLVVHGTEDLVMPVSLGRNTSAWLSQQGFAVELKEFEGGHHLPSDFQEILTEALAP